MNMASLSDLQSPIKGELKLFEQKFKESMKSSVPLLDRVTYYIVQRKGKQVRPMFVFLCAKLIQDANDSTYTAASLIELLHTGTLVHDDVADDSNMRRGFFSINALWKNKIAVLVGDYLLAKGFLIALDNDEIGALKIMSKAIREMSEGELLQIEKSRKLNLSEEVYFKIIRQKTASLIACACEAGLASVSSDHDHADKIREFGYATGMAFQIKDDLFDYGFKNVGKPTGIDIKEKKLTLPLIHALSVATGEEKRAIIKKLKKSSEKKSTQEEIIDFVKAKGGIEYSEKVMLSFRDKAVSLLHHFDDNIARRTLEQLVDFVVTRNN